MSLPSTDVPKILEPAHGVWVRQEIDNLTWIDMGDHLIAIDALEKAEDRDDVFAAIERTAPGKPVRTLINTHTHYDHVALNEAFRQRWGAEAVNLANTTIPADGRWFDGPRRRLLLRPMPGCHTAEDAIVWVPDARALCVGDIFGWGIVPLTVNLRQENFEHLKRTFAELIAYGATTVVPGHGPLCDTATLERFVAYLDTLVADAHRLAAEGQSPDEIAAALPPPSDMADWWRFLAWKHADTAGKIAKSVCKGWLRPAGE